MEEIKPPSLLDQVKSLAESVKNWTVKDALHRVSPQTLEFRKNICKSCEHWDSEAFGGIGKCKICGCTATKLYIPSASCPLPTPKWVAVSSVDEKGNATYSSRVKKSSLTVTGKTPTEEPNP